MQAASLLRGSDHHAIFGLLPLLPLVVMASGRPSFVLNADPQFPSVSRGKGPVRSFPKIGANILPDFAEAGQEEADVHLAKPCRVTLIDARQRIARD